MCRLLGIVASERTSFHFTLQAAPRSLAQLSSEHPHGWGIAVYDNESGWTLQKRPVRAGDCEHFYAAASTIQGELLVAHVRARTVGPVTAANTHPFRQDRWLFAHNGTLTSMDFLRDRTSPERLSQIAGQTDSELLFAYLLTCLDEAGVTSERASARTDRAITQAMQTARAEPSLGAYNFLLSDGDTIYAHRFGRTLFLLDRTPADPVCVHRHSHETGVAIDTPWSAARHAILVASEQMSEEPWQTIEEGTLLRCDRTPLPHWRILDPLALSPQRHQSLESVSHA